MDKVSKKKGKGVPQDNLPHDVRLIAAVSRLIDIHQSRREAGGASVPEVPEKAGFNLFLSLTIIDALHDIEMDRGVGYCPINELISRVRKRNPEFTDSDVDYGITNLKQAREIHYGTVNDVGTASYGRTWDTTPLVDVQEGLQTALASESNMEVAACKLSLQDMLRQPKDKPLVLTETVMNCGKHGQHSLEALYGQGWRLIQIVSDEGAGARIAIFERSRQ